MTKPNKMSREEKILSYEIEARKELDPLFIDRLQFHLATARGQLKKALKEIQFSPEDIDRLDYKVRTYGKLLSVALKMIGVAESTKEDVFAEANITAQKEEAEKQGKATCTVHSEQTGF